MKYEDFVPNKKVFQKRMLHQESLVEKINSLLKEYNEELKDFPKIKNLGIDSGKSKEYFSVLDLKSGFMFDADHYFFNNKIALEGMLNEWSFYNPYLNVKLLYLEYNNSYKLDFSFKEEVPIPFYLLPLEMNDDYKDDFMDMILKVLDPSLLNVGHYHIIELFDSTLNEIHKDNHMGIKAKLRYVKNKEIFEIEYTNYRGYLKELGKNCFGAEEHWENSLLENFEDYEGIIQFFKEFIPIYKDFAKSIYVLMENLNDMESESKKVS